MRDHGPSRRRVLAAFTALPVAGFAGCRGTPGDPGSPGPASPSPAPDRAPEPPRWVPDAPLDEAAFPLGVAAGDVTDGSVLLAVRSTAASVGLRVMAGDGDQGWVEAAADDGIPVVDGTARIEVVGLQPDTVYAYAFFTAAGDGRSEVGRFRTALGPDSPARKLVIGATSCLGGEEPAFPSLARAAEQDLDLMLLLGDTVYADGAVTLEDYRAVWDEVRGVPAFRTLLASTSVVATWDDHEVANNWTYGEPDNFQDRVTEAQVAAATSAFREAIPQRVPDDGPSWRSLRWGDVLELLVLDCRGERDPGVRIVSQAQLDWAVERLSASPARFKLVLASVHVTDHAAMMGEVQAVDRWQGYPDQRTALLTAAAAAPGTLFVTGDMHYGAIQRADPEGGPGAGLWEIAAGPAGSELFPFLTLAGLMEEIPPQYEAVVEGWSWARIALDPGTGEVRVQLIDGQGEVVAEQRLML